MYSNTVRIPNINVSTINNGIYKKVLQFYLSIVVACFRNAPHNLILLL